MSDQREGERRSPRLRRALVAIGSALGAGLAAVLAADLYGVVRDRVTGGAGETVMTAGPTPTDATPTDPPGVVDPLATEVVFNDPCPGYVFPAGSPLPSAEPSEEGGLAPGPDRASIYAGGGADVSGTAYRVTVQGRSEAAVVLQGLDVVDVEALPSPGELTYSGPTCLAFAPPRRLVSLDLDGPALDFATAVGEPVEFPLQVSLTDVEVFTVTATTQTCFCRWALELRWFSAGQSGTTRIEPPWGAFTTAPRPAAPPPEPEEPVIVWTPPPVRNPIPPDLLLPDVPTRERVPSDLLTPAVP